eukprot:TRINITY_DN26770_c0_g1_i1.p1 TRINITY_DN26770_c0_g1~~TRINITY_DN26770_c0_g1_i1.p1  ORF type:complete len:274 (-),score=94.01 TRINITY_DN26770_c0_g1_i1:51-821(-)
MGNATSSADLTFDFAPTSPATAAAAATMPTLPFQIQIRFSKPGDAGQHTRVFSQRSLVTDDRAVACGGGMRVSVIALAAVQRAALLAEANDFAQARHTLLSVQKLLCEGKTDQQQEEYSNFMAACETLDGVLQNLSRGQRNDSTTRILLKMKNSQRVTFQSGASKNVTKRTKHVTKPTAPTAPTATASTPSPAASASASASASSSVSPPANTATATATATTVAPTDTTTTTATPAPTPATDTPTATATPSTTVTPT